MIKSLLIFSVFTLLTWFISPVFSFLSWLPFFSVLLTKANFIKKTFHVFCYFLAWNLIVTFWLIDISPFKALLIYLLNSFLMLIPFAFYELIVRYKPIQDSSKLLLFISLWLTYEFVTYYWFFSWPWLILGNTFGQAPNFIQWYSITGVLGGSFWIMFVNFFIHNYIFSSGNWYAKIKLISAILFPIIISYSLSNKHIESNNNYNLLLVQTPSSIDTLSDANKIGMVSFALRNKINSDIDYVVIPELFLNSVHENFFHQSSAYYKFRFLVNGLKAKLVFGTNLIGNHSDQAGISTFYEKFNVALQIDTSNKIPLKHKKIFIPFEEYIPNWLSFLPLKSAGYSFNPNNLNSFKISKSNSFTVLICYEAVNSPYVSKNIQRTDEFILMLASESFMQNENSAGKTQYNNICRIRAIETGKPLIKLSHAGSNIVFDSRGKIVYQNVVSAIEINKVQIEGSDLQTIFTKINYWPFVFANFLCFCFVVRGSKSNLKWKT